MTTFTFSLRTRFARLPRPVRILGYVMLVYLLYLIVLGWITPKILLTQLPKVLHDQLGRTATVQHISINPFLSRIQLDQVAIAQANTSTPFVAFQQLDVELNLWQSVFTLTPTLQHIYLQQPSVTMARYNNAQHSLSIADIVQHMAANRIKAPQPATQTNSALPQFRIRSLRLDRGEIHFHDHVSGANLNYGNLSFSITDLDTAAPIRTNATASAANQTTDSDPKNTFINHYAIRLHGHNHSELELSGRFQLQPLKVIGEIELSRQSLASLWPYAKPFTTAKLNSGTVSFSSQYHITQRHDQLVISTSQGRFRLQDITLTNPQDRPVIRIPTFSVTGIATNSQQRQVNIHTIRLDQFWLQGRVSKHGLDLMSLFQPRTRTVSRRPQTSTTASAVSPATPVTTASSPTSSAWVANVDQLDIHQAHIQLHENIASQGVYWRLAPISLNTGPIDSRLTQPIHYQLSAGMTASRHTIAEAAPAQGTFSSEGEVNGHTLAVESDVKLTDFNLPQIGSYLAPYLNVHLKQGQLNLTGHISRPQSGNIKVTSNLNIQKFALQDTVQQQPLLKWQNMTIDKLTYQQTPPALTIQTITLTHPFSRILINKDKTTNLTKLVNTPTKPKNSEKTGLTNAAPAHHPVKAAPMAINIKKIAIRHGDAYFSDQSLQPNFASGIEQLNGTITQLSTNPKTTAKVNIKGQIDQYAPLTLTGSINPLLAKPSLNLNLNFKHVELTSVNPYSGTYAGYYIDKGQLSSEFHYQLKNGQLQGKNHVVINQLTLGKASDSKLATNLPVRLAIALLQDRNGVIDLGVDVSGDIHSPSFSLGGVILKAFMNIITKAVTAPFSLLANLVSSEDELNRITFEAGSATLTPAEQSRLDTLVKGLIDRPQLNLSIKGDMSPKEDAYALAQQSVQQQLLKLSELSALPVPFSASQIPQSGPLAEALETLYEKTLKKSVSAEQDRVTQQLTTQANGVTPSDQHLTTVLYMGLYNQLVNAQTISQQALGALAQSRAKVIKYYLVKTKHMDSGRIFLLDSRNSLKQAGSQAELTLSVND